MKAKPEKAGDKTPSGRVVKCWRVRYRNQAGAQAADFSSRETAYLFFAASREEGDTVRRIVRRDPKPAPAVVRCWVAVGPRGRITATLDSAADADTFAKAGALVIEMVPAAELEKARRQIAELESKIAHYIDAHSARVKELEEARRLVERFARWERGKVWWTDDPSESAETFGAVMADARAWLAREGAP